MIWAAPMGICINRDRSVEKPNPLMSTDANCVVSHGLQPEWMGLTLDDGHTVVMPPLHRQIEKVYNTRSHS